MPEDSSSPWLSWKVVSSLFELVLMGEVVITLVFWGVLYQGETITYYTLKTHSFPLVLLLTDWHMNKILVELRHIVPAAYAVNGYALFLVTYTLSTQDAIYDKVNLETTGSWIMLGAIIVLGLTTHLILTAYSRFWFWLFYDDTKSIDTSILESYHWLVVID